MSGHSAKLLVIVTLLMGCNLSAGRPGKVVQEAGAGADLRDVGGYAVARHPIWAPARYTDAVRADIYYPSDQTGLLDESGAPYPGLLMIQEQGRQTRDFEWLAMHLASWGYVVATPHHPISDPSLASDNAVWTREALRALSADSTSFMAGGMSESLGLVRFYATGDAVQSLDEDPTYLSLALVASQPVSPSTGQIVAPTLLIEGSRDCVVDATVGWENYEVSRTLALLEGVSHSQVIGGSVLSPGDDGDPDCTAQDLSCDTQMCVPTLTLEEAQRRIAGVLTAFERQVLEGGVPLADAASSWGGLTLQEATPTPTPQP